jgi:hypothetical protein
MAEHPSSCLGGQIVRWAVRLLLGGIVFLLPLSCSEDPVREPDLSIHELMQENMLAVLEVQKSHPEIWAADVGELLESVLENDGWLDVVQGEKWPDFKARLAREHKAFLIPVIEKYAAKCRASTELREEGHKVLTPQQVQDLIRKYKGPFRRPPMDVNESIARRSLSDLNMDWSLKTPEAERSTNDIRAATPDRGYHGYWFVECGDGGFMAIPCNYGQSGIHTFIRMRGIAGGYYKKDLRGGVLSALPKDPEKEGWTEIRY